MRRLQLKHQEQNGSELCVMATGGGAFKYYEEIKKALEVEVLREDEMECLIIGGDLLFRRNHRQEAQLTVTARTRFLHPGNTVRSLHAQSLANTIFSSYGLSPTTNRYISLSTR